MEAVRGEEFLRWAAGAGIGFDPRYRDSRRLRLLPPRDHARFWALPADPAAWPHFLLSLLEALDAWETAFLWPRPGSWPESGRSRSCNERVRDAVLRGAGVPDGWPGPVRFGRAECGALAAVLFVYVAFGGCGDDDLFFIPDHGRQLVRTDHHDVVHAECGSEERVRKLVAGMAAAGYELPADPPDETFKRPAWMGGAEQAAAADRPRD